jgi:hypothetical protein
VLAELGVIFENKMHEIGVDAMVYRWWPKIGKYWGVKSMKLGCYICVNEWPKRGTF